MESSKRCRVCLVSKKDEPLKSLRGGGKAVFFEKQFGINVSLISTVQKADNKHFAILADG